ncbi:Hypothetical protein AA314_04880 [Archangium gephyra]|uniref:Uncharacterized protein n=1 Tax=Archangium gephyra TaxID=48 RepID=A0AAC8Q9I4_9BACT|nr:Hypothetical protein AA314_04880 [Archangium gephyra]
MTVCPRHRAHPALTASARATRVSTARESPSRMTPARASSRFLPPGSRGRSTCAGRHRAAPAWAPRSTSSSRTRAPTSSSATPNTAAGR